MKNELFQKQPGETSEPGETFELIEINKRCETLLNMEGHDIRRGLSYYNDMGRLIDNDERLLEDAILAVVLQNKELIFSVMQLGAHYLVISEKLDIFKSILDLLEINGTKSRFLFPENVVILEKLSKSHGLTRWIAEQNKTPNQITRKDIIDWWDYYTTIGENAGLRIGTIDNISQETNLWKATKSLAIKMKNYPSLYRFLPQSLINNPQEVSRALNEIVEPKAFIEVLTGETWEDMVKVPNFLLGFIVSNQQTPNDKQDNQNTDTICINAISTIKLALQRG